MIGHRLQRRSALVGYPKGNWMQLGIGNNYVSGAQGELTAIMLAGARIFSAEWSDGPLVASLNIWDKQGQHVARLRRGAWVFNSPELTITTAPDRLTLMDGERLLAEVLKPQPDYIWLRQADLYAKDGTHLLITPENNYDLELFWDDTSLVALRQCYFQHPHCVIEVTDDGPTVGTAEGIIVSKSIHGTRFEHCTFAGPSSPEAG